MFRKSVDILAIGDITVDAFIKLKQAKLHCKVDHENCEIALPFGGKIPYEFTKVIYAAGGAPNAAVAAARLGLKTSLISNLGHDQSGFESISLLQKEGVQTDKVREHNSKPTSCNYILWFENDRTILVNHTDYGYDHDALHPTKASVPRWIYLTSLSNHGSLYEKSLIDFLDARPQVKLAFQPGTFQLSRGIDELRPMREIFPIFSLVSHQLVRKSSL